MSNLSHLGNMQPLLISVTISVTISVASIFLNAFVVFLRCDAIGSLAFSRDCCLISCGSCGRRQHQKAPLFFHGAPLALSVNRATTQNISDDISVETADSK